MSSRHSVPNSRSSIARGFWKAIGGSCISLMVLAPLPAGLAGQTPGDTVLATPRGRYPAPLLKRALLGPGYRDVWGAPVPAVVLDLGTFAGGLEPLRKGGGQQTQSLRFQAGDGQVYTFRSIDKDVSRGVDPALRGTVAERVLQDQISSLLPLSALVVSPLLEAVGVFNPGPVLRVMPDDPRLGEFREEFAGLLGWVEVRPDEGEDPEDSFEGALQVISSPRLYERLEEGSDTRVDARGFLKARLMDFLVGDWDRHPDQWRWAGFEREVGDRETILFEPIPRDRDWALSRIDGLLGMLAPYPWPQYTGFSDEYPNAFNASWNGRGLDRRFLAELGWSEFEEVVLEVQGRLTDEVIDAAVGGLPDSYLEVIGEELSRGLYQRRNRMPQFAREYYELLSGWVDIEATDENEIVLVERFDDGRVRVAVFDTRRGDARDAPYVDRTFLPDETHEVRLYLMGGDDEVEVTGPGGPITVRVMGGGGDETYQVVAGEGPDAPTRADSRGIRFYDHRGDQEVEGPVVLDEEEWEEPHDEEAILHGARPLDWGSRWMPLPDVGFNSDQGLVVGAGAQRIGWGFRQHPYATLFTARAGIATRTRRGRATLELDAPFFGTGARSLTSLRYRGDRFLNYYGLGNETDAEGTRQFFSAQRTDVWLESRVAFSPAEGVQASIGPSFRFGDPHDIEGTLLETQAPYGVEGFRQLGLRAAVAVDRRDALQLPRSGFFASVEGAWNPALLDVEETFFTLDGQVSTYLSLDGGLAPVLALRAAGRRQFGDYPYLEAAYLGGSDLLRGFVDQRFAGDASVVFNAELRVNVTDFFFLFPGDLGLLGLFDTGRVFVEGESSDRWHSAFGGGIWGSWLGAYALSASVAHSEESTRVYILAGLPF